MSGPSFCSAPPENWPLAAIFARQPRDDRNKTKTDARCHINSSRSNVARSLLEVGDVEFQRRSCVQPSASKEGKTGERRETVSSRSKLAMDMSSGFLSNHVQPAGCFFHPDLVLVEAEEASV